MTASQVMVMNILAGWLAGWRGDGVFNYLHFHVSVKNFLQASPMSVSLSNCGQHCKEILAEGRQLSVLDRNVYTPGLCGSQIVAGRDAGRELQRPISCQHENHAIH